MGQKRNTVRGRPKGDRTARRIMVDNDVDTLLDARANQIGRHGAYSDEVNARLRASLGLPQKGATP